MPNQKELAASGSPSAVAGPRSGIAQTIWPGLEFTFYDINAPSYSPSPHKRPNVIEMSYCLTGRGECVMRDGCYQYIGQGDLFLNLEANHSGTVELPLGYYQGIYISLDLDQAQQALPALLPDLALQLHTVAGRLFSGCGCRMIPAPNQLQHIFSPLLSASSTVWQPLCRLKMLELLLYLHSFEPLPQKQQQFFDKEQVQIIKQIQRQLTEQPARRFTIEELAKQHCISPTVLKSNFKGVYGTSIAAYMKNYRIGLAADLLVESQKSVAEIALEVGYSSQSKFGAAFKEQMEMSPLEYRKKFQLGL